MSQWESLLNQDLDINVSEYAKSLTSFLRAYTKEPPRNEIRASALPVCGRHYSFNLILPKSEIPDVHTDFLLDLASATGTATHSIVQKWLGSVGILVGDWKCLNCGKEKEWHKGTPVCKKCNKPMVYKELSLEHPILKIPGHPDGILAIGDSYAGFELKTKSQDVVDSMSEPIDSHVDYQAACYAALLKMIRGIDLKEYIFFYLSRGLPWSYKVGYSDRGKKVKVIYKRGKGGKFLLKIFRMKINTDLVEEEFRYIQKFRKAQHKAGKKLLPLAEWGICKDPSDENSKYCPHRYICFSKWVDKRYR